MKILVIMWSMYIGGTTKSLIPFLKLLKRKGFDVELYLIDKGEESRKYVPEEIKLVDIPELDEIVCMPTDTVEKIKWMLQRNILHIALKQKLVTFFPKKDREEQRKAVMRLYQERDIATCINSKKKVDLSEKYDVVMSWGEFLPDYAVANNIICEKKYGWIHPDYATGGFDPKLDKKALAGLTGLVAVSKSGYYSMIQAFPEWKKHIYAVPNVMDVNNLRALAKEQQTEIPYDNTFKIVTVARIHNISKAFDRAVRIAANLKKRGCKFCWYVVGDGEDKEFVNEQIVENQLQDNMKLLGAKDNPYPYMAAGDLFVLQSYYEGKPLVVDEALVVGTPVLVTNYVSAREQVAEEIGIVVNNEESAIIDAMENIIKNPQKAEFWKKNLETYDFGYLTECPAFFEMINQK